MKRSFLDFLKPPARRSGTAAAPRPVSAPKRVVGGAAAGTASRPPAPVPKSYCGVCKLPDDEEYLSMSRHGGIQVCDCPPCPGCRGQKSISGRTCPICQGTGKQRGGLRR